MYSRGKRWQWRCTRMKMKKMKKKDTGMARWLYTKTDILHACVSEDRYLLCGWQYLLPDQRYNIKRSNKKRL